MNENKALLTSVLQALDNLEVRGKRNHTIIIACMNDIERVIKDLEGKEMTEDGDIHAEP